MNALFAVKRYGVAIASGGAAIILAVLFPGAVPVYLPLAIATPALLLSASVPEPVRSKRGSAQVATGSAAFVIALGLTVLVGWSSHIPMVIQLLPQLPPMMKNTAVAFALSGLALFLQSVGRLRWLVLVCAVIVGSLGLINMVEYVFGVNIGTDEILGRSSIAFADTNPGRSAPASSVCFVLESLGLILAARSFRVRSAWPLGLIGSVIAAVGFVTSLEFSLGSSKAFGWGNFTGMAVHTAVGLCALGLGIVALAWQAEDHRQSTPLWLPVSVVIGVATGAVGVWQGLIAGGQEAFSPIPAIVLIGGGGIAMTFGLTVALAQRARSRTILLRDSERQLRLIVETLPVEIYTANPQGSLTFFNQRMARNAGLEQGDLVALNKRVHLDPGEEPRISRSWWHSMSTGEPFASLHRVRRYDGTYRWYQELAEPLRDESGRVIQWYGVQIDVDDQRNLEEVLLATRTRLAHATRLATVAELSAAIAHEVNQPLAAVVANAGACHRWLSAVPPNLERARLTAERIIRDGKAASEVVNRVRALFKQTTPTAIQLNLNEVIAEVHQLMLDENSSRRVNIETDLERDLPLTLADRVQMQQVLVNLARNGIDAMESTMELSKILSIRSRREGADQLRIEVCDRGSGLKDAEKAFEPFFTTKRTGMGMGLAICRSIIEAHQGRIWATRNEDQGTTFNFTLPILSSEPQ
jgi:PAS domain S-box-containing protein